MADALMLIHPFSNIWRVLHSPDMPDSMRRRMISSNNGMKKKPERDRMIIEETLSLTVNLLSINFRFISNEFFLYKSNEPRLMIKLTYTLQNIIADTKILYHFCGNLRRKLNRKIKSKSWQYYLKSPHHFLL